MGDDTCPKIKKNVIKFCIAPAIKVGANSNGEVIDNHLVSNQVGVIIEDNKTVVRDNKIDKSHDDGVKVICNGKDNFCNPDIQHNHVFGSKFNGILVKGDKANPKISENTIENNK